MRASRLAGACGLAGAERGARGVKDPFQGTLATSDGGRLRAFRYSGEARSRSLFSPATSACSGRCIPGGRSCGGCPVTPGWWSPSRSVTCPVPGMRCLSKLGVIGKGHPGCCPAPPSSRRRPGDRVRAGVRARWPIVPRTPGHLALTRGPRRVIVISSRLQTILCNMTVPGRSLPEGRQGRPGGRLRRTRHRRPK